MEGVDIEKVTKDDMSFPPQSQWNSYTVRIHSIVIGLCVGAGCVGGVCVCGVGGGITTILTVCVYLTYIYDHLKVAHVSLLCVQ